MSILAKPLSVALKERAHAHCPGCDTPVAPSADSTMTLAWYECACGEQWVCRLRNGMPDAAIAGAYAMMGRELMRVA